jgi:hypothetical protein
MAEQRSPKINVSLPKPGQRDFAIDMAERFFGGNQSAYVAALIDLDQARGLTRAEVQRRLTELSDAREEVAS